MPPKVIVIGAAKAKAKAAVAKAKAKAMAKAAGAMAILPMAAAGGGVAPAAVPAVNMIIGSVQQNGISMHIYDGAGDTTYHMTCDAVAQAFASPPLTLVRPDIQFTVVPPPAAPGVLPLGGKGVGKGAGLWNPGGTWDMIVNAELTPAGVRPTQVEVGCYAVARRLRITFGLRFLCDKTGGMKTTMFWRCQILSLA
jgi:hypothetical protein